MEAQRESSLIGPMTNFERRLRNLDALFTDGSGLTPHTARWLEYWVRQIYLYMTDEGSHTLFPMNAFRAVLQNSDKPGSLVGSVRSDD